MPFRHMYSPLLQPSLSSLPQEKHPKLSDLLDAHVDFVSQYVYSVNFPKSPSHSRIKGNHGIAHVTRAALYIPLFVHLHQAWAPADSSVHTLLTDDIILYCQIAALWHDSAREAEGPDYWDMQSGQNVLTYLLTLGCPEKVAITIAEATANKDWNPEDPNPEDPNLENHLYTFFTVQADTLSSEIRKPTSDERKQLQQGLAKLIRELIHDADCLDILRCILDFDPKYLHVSQQYPMQQTDINQLVQLASKLIFTKAPDLHFYEYANENNPPISQKKSYNKLLEGLSQYQNLKKWVAEIKSNATQNKPEQIKEPGMTTEAKFGSNQNNTTPTKPSKKFFGIFGEILKEAFKMLLAGLVGIFLFIPIYLKTRKTLLESKQNTDALKTDTADLPIFNAACICFRKQLGIAYSPEKKASLVRDPDILKRLKL